jgi:hypothetical protein
LTLVRSFGPTFLFVILSSPFDFYLSLTSPFGFYLSLTSPFGFYLSLTAPFPSPLVMAAPSDNMARLSSGVVDPFHLDRLRQMVMCKTCRRGVSADNTCVDNHLSKHHTNQFDSAQRQEIRLRYVGKNFLVKTDTLAIKGAMAHGGHPYLPFEDGFTCPLDGCYSGQSFKTVAAHMTKHHPQTSERPRQCKVSWLFGEAKGLFEVQSESAPALPVTHVADDTVLQQARQTLVSTIQARRTQQSVVRPSVTGRETLWAERTGWPTTFVDLDMARLSTLVDLTAGPGEDAAAVTWLREQVRALMRRCDAHLGDTFDHAGEGTFVRRLLWSADDEVAGRPMYRLRESQVKYGLIFERFVLFLVRMARWSSPEQAAVRFTMPSSLADAVVALEAATQTRDAAEAGQLVHLACRLVIQQERSYGGPTNPMLYFLGVAAFRVSTATWMTPQDWSPVLSAVVYGIRILALGYVFDEAGEDVASVIPRLQTYRQRYLRNGSPTLFDEVFSQRNYAGAVASEFYSRPTIHWEEDRSALLYQGTRIQINAVQTWLRSLLAEAEDLLAAQLLGMGVSDLRVYDPARLTDNLTWEQCGASLITMNHETLENRLDMAVQRAEADPSLHWHRVWAQPLAMRHKIYSRYHRTVHEFLQKLGPLMMVAGGGEPRATEVGAALWCNTQTGMRSYYVALGHLMWVADYGKSEVLSHAPRVIARFYPRRVGQLVVGFLAEVRPFLELLAILSEQHSPDVYSDLVFHTHGRPWTAEQLTPALEQTTELHLGVKVGVRAWRHIHVALYQEALQDEVSASGRLSTAHDNVDAGNGALHSGHTAEVEAHHYALSVDMLRGLHEKAMTVFMRHSQRWHRFLGLDEPCTAAKSKKRVRPSPDPMSAIANRLDRIEVLLRGITTTGLTSVTSGTKDDNQDNKKEDNKKEDDKKEDDKKEDDKKEDDKKEDKDQFDDQFNDDFDTDFDNDFNDNQPGNKNADENAIEHADRNADENTIEHADGNTDENTIEHADGNANGNANGNDNGNEIEKSIQNTIQKSI